MKKLAFFLFFFLVLPSLITSVNYRAAVVQYLPIFPSGNPTKAQAVGLMNRNVDNWEAFIKSAKAKGAQLVVFPEDGIYGSNFTRDRILPFLEDLPDPTQSVVVPCGNAKYSHLPVLQRLSCIAKKYSIILVCDMGDLKYCNRSDPDCPQDGRYQFNTAVAFSEEGQFLARYHKSHLFTGEVSYFNQPKNSDPTFFVSSFGVKFGLIICYDLTFQQPTKTYLEKYQIKNIIHPTWWQNTLPILDAVMAQQSFSSVYHINLLSANSAWTPLQSGFGIYSQGNSLVYHFDPIKSGDMAMLIADINSDGEEVRGGMAEKLLLPYSLLPHQLHADQTGHQMKNELPAAKMRTFLATPGSSGNISIHLEDVTCNVSYQVSSNQPENRDGQAEQFGVAIIRRSYGNTFICTLLVCPKVDVCLTERADHLSFTTFDYFHVSGTFPPSEVLLPVASVNGGQLVTKGTIVIGSNFISSSSSNFNQTLLSAGIFGRVDDNM